MPTVTNLKDLKIWEGLGACDTLRLVPLTSLSPPEKTVRRQFFISSWVLDNPLPSPFRWSWVKIPYLPEGTLHPKGVSHRLKLCSPLSVGCGGRAPGLLAHPLSHCLWKDPEAAQSEGVLHIFQQVNQPLSCPCLVRVCVCGCVLYVLTVTYCYSSKKTSSRKAILCKVGICFLPFFMGKSRNSLLI